MSETTHQMTEEQTAQKPEVRIHGVLYRLRFDLGALEEIEKE